MNLKLIQQYKYELIEHHNISKIIFLNIFKVFSLLFFECVI